MVGLDVEIHIVSETDGVRRFVDIVVFRVAPGYQFGSGDNVFILTLASEPDDVLRVVDIVVFR